ncbi:MAG: hypothetical protein H6737_12270 [Alphaproteobacteria bacterium]|nr:hypothetical protein [Alphaproteobacteria bacterium]
MHRAFLLATSLVLAACKAEPQDSDPAPEDLSVTLLANGPYGVGYVEQSVTYDPGDGPRTLRLAVWYPSDTHEGPELRYQGAFPAPGVIGDAPVADGPFPLVVYSHGHQGYAEASGRIVSQLVSHGYVVASPDHTGNTAFDGSDRTTAIFWQRPRDIGAVLDHVTAPAHLLAGHLSDAPIVGIGHSFGGYTMHALAGATYDTATLFPGCAAGDTQDFCSTMTPDQEALFSAGLRDDRITSIIAMAPGNLDLFTASGLEAIGIPELHMTGQLDNPTLNEATWAGLDRAGNLRTNLEDGGHNIFSDFASALDSGPEYIDPEVGWPIIGAYWLAWIRAHHGDDTVAPVLDGTLVFGDTTEVVVGGQ